MIRLNQRRLIIPRGDTGFFAVPALATSSTDNIAVFSIIDMTTKTLVFQKEVEVSDEIIKIEFSHNDTVNLPVGKYVWDIKFYQNPSYADGELVNGDEIDSYYAGYTLPPCEIRETADKLLVSPDSPSATLTPEQLDIISAAIISLEDAIEKTGANVEHYPTIIDDYWYVWDADAGEYVNTEVSANGIPGPTGNGIESIVFNNDYSLTITLTDGQVVTTRSIRGEVGPPPNLTIGTVTEGATAAATITGTAADPVLNLVLPTADVTAKADKVDTVLETSLSRGRKANTTVGVGSLAFGTDVEASGVNSVGLGSATTASGHYSMAQGALTTASGWASHAEGNGTLASGTQSHAEGGGTRATAMNAHAEGELTIANASNMLAIGYRNTGSEIYPEWVAGTSYDVGDKVYHSSFGYKCITANSDSQWTSANWQLLPSTGTTVFAIGNGTPGAQTGSNALTVDWDGNEYLAGDLYIHANNDSTGGVKVATINDIPAAPSTNGVALVSVNGEWTNQAGYGYVGDVDGYVDTVLEEETIAVSSGAGETINCLKFPNTDKLSIFINNVEYIYERTAVDRVDIIYTAVDESAPIKSFKFQVYYEEDHYTFIKRYFVHFKDQNFLDESVTLKIIEKNDSIKKIDNKFLNAKAGQGYGAIITSDDNVAEGHGAFAEGLKTTAISVGAHAEGYATTAQDMGSHAEGYGTMAFGGLSHAEGSSSISRGYGSHAEGSTTAAIGSYSHTEGTATIATGGDSHVGGRFNIMDSDDFIPTWTAGTSYSVRDRVKYEGKNYVCIKNNSSSTFKNSEWDYTYYLRYAEIIGNGLDIDTRSNARALDWDGNEYLNGDLYLNCESDSTNGTSVGQTLTDIKSKINSIVAPDESDLIANSEYSIGDLLTINGTLYKATAAIAQGGAISIDGANPNVAPTTVDNEFVRFTDYANADTGGVVKIMAQGAGGLGMTNQGYLCFAGANDTQIKAGTNLNIAPSVGRQHVAAFYGLARAAGDTTQVASSNAVGTYTDDAKNAIKAMLGVEDKTEVAVTQTQTSGYKIATVSVDNTDTDLYIPKIADEFDSTKSYNPGAIVMHNGKTYMLIGVTSLAPGAWNDSNWNECAVGNACEAAITFIDAVRLQNIYRDIRTKLTAPSVSGTNGQVLVSDGNGNQVWQTLDVGSDITVTPTFNAGQKVATISVDNVDTDLFIPKFVDEFDSTKTYYPGSLVLHDGKTYIYTQQQQSSGEWDPDNWVEQFLGSIAGTAFMAASQMEYAFDQMEDQINTKLTAPSTAGTSGQVLTINNSGTPVWATPAASGAMIDDTAGAGDTNVTFSADKLTTMDSALKSAIDEKEDTPVVVIFTISQNAGVYTVTANKTPNELYAEYKAGAKIRAYQVSTNTGSIIDMACNVQESTDFYQFRFSSVESRLLCGYDGYIMGIKDGNWEYHNYEIMVASDINSEFYANTRRIASLGDPVNDYDAATKNYVDTHAVAVPDLEITFSVEIDSETGAARIILSGATWAEFVAAWTAGKTISATFQAGAIAELTSIYYDSTSGTAFFTGAIGSSVKPQSVLVVWGANTLDYTIESGGISDVRINDSSVVTNGVANIPVASSSSFGTIKVMDNAAGGLGMTAQGYLCFSGANESQIKAGTTPNLAPPVSRQHMAVFYGLAKAAGDTTQASSSNTVGTYTSEAKAAIQTMLGIDMPTKTSDLTNDSYFVSASFNDDELVLATAATWAEGVSF